MVFRITIELDCDKEELKAVKQDIWRSLTELERIEDLVSFKVDSF